ncbi:zinc dependent phospholipase C [Acinetobacter tandoii]|uniref:DUF4184 family protein n=1 Tax=Acinetobacter tandoii TaxID=202954 RepID=UPI000C2091E1|nr:DUF4184 family protein [Acinetobacter tandoii]PJG44841.1 zinc dependent phospholipase C [Acinetobacter tandoii]
MPFTLSHAVLAPPLSKLTQGRLPIAALAIGCMTPDLIRLFTQHDGGKTHLWRALIEPNLWIGLIFCLFWYALYRPVLYRFFGLNDPLRLNRPRSIFGFAVGVVLAILLGVSTHLIWDGLTHVDFRTFAFHDFLSQNIMLFGYSFPVHLVLQIGTSAAALPFLFWMCAHYYQKFRQSQTVTPSIKIYAWSLLGFTLLIGSFSVWEYARYFSQELWMSNWYYLTGRIINDFTQTVLIVWSLGCLLFLFFDHRQYSD